MAQATIDVFSEGATEKGVLEKLCSRGVCPHALTERGGGGEQEMLRKLGLALRAWFDLAEEQREPLRVLVLRDLDAHQGRTVARLCESVQNIVRRHHPTAKLAAQLGHSNVFILQANPPRLRLALHIADQPHRPEFIKSTIDDYVLNLSLRQATAEALLQACRRSDWTITAAQLLGKVQQELPELLKRNGIPHLIEAKEYVRLYAAILQLATNPAIFAQKLLTHAAEEDVCAVFAPLLAAVQFLAEETAAP